MKRNQSLLHLNTFGINVSAETLIELSGNPESFEFPDLDADGKELLILGGGSNVLFTKDFEGTVLLNRISGVEKIEEDENHIYVRVGAGENWHAFVQYCILHGYAGIENLSLIPGNVGASPMQNIGAYGVEVKNVIEKVNGIYLDSGLTFSFSTNECEFGYRSSIFKTSLRNKVLITDVIFRLNKFPEFHISYGAIQDELEAMNVSELSIAHVGEAVCAIRRRKLPDPSEIGNAGSFFKNPVVGKELLNELRDHYEEIPNYEVDENHTKLAAGWLIEKCGWKGKRMGNFGVHEKQALVLVNYGGAKGADVLQLSQNIQQSVWDTFGVQLETEVNIY